jgi:uncharacterized protein YegP (UPF0339 family)
VARPRAVPTLKARIYKKRWQLLVRKPTFKQHYWFVLIGMNDEPIAKSEEYTQKHNALEILKRYFPNAEIEDLSGDSN